MTHVENQPSITKGNVFVEGIIGGSLLSMGIFMTGYGVAFQAVLAVVGILVLLETLLPSHMDVHSMTLSLGIMAGFVISIFVIILRIADYYTAIVLISTVMVYMVRALKRMGYIHF